VDLSKLPTNQPPRPLEPLYKSRFNNWLIHKQKIVLCEIQVFHESQLQKLEKLSAEVLMHRNWADNVIKTVNVKKLELITAEQKSFSFIEQFLDAFQKRLSCHSKVFQEMSQNWTNDRFKFFTNFEVFAQHCFKKTLDQVRIFGFLTFLAKIKYHFSDIGFYRSGKNLPGFHSFGKNVCGDCKFS